MTPELKRYLAGAYRRDVLRESVKVAAPRATSLDDLIAEIEAELARIDALKLGANLATRDFISYQNRRVLQKLLADLKQPKSGTLAAVEGADRANFR